MLGTAPNKGASPFGTLCEETLVHVLSFLTLDERMRTATLSRRFRGACGAPKLWERISFDGVYRPLTYDSLDSLCSRAGGSLRTFDLHALGNIKEALFPVSAPPHVEPAPSTRHRGRLAHADCVMLLRRGSVWGRSLIPVRRVRLFTEPERAAFADPFSVRLPFSKDKNPLLSTFIAWDETHDEATLLSPREIKAVVHNMAHPHHLQVAVHAGAFQAGQVHSLLSSFVSACASLVITRCCIEDTHIEDAASDAGVDAVDALCAALRSDTDGRVCRLNASFLDITDDVAATIAGAIASIPSCGLRRLDLDFNEMSNAGAAALVTTLLGRHLPMVVSLRHMMRLSDAGRAALIKLVQGTDVRLILLSETDDHDPTRQPEYTYTIVQH